MTDQTETIRHKRLTEINAEPGSREALVAEHGQVWDTTELAADFNVTGFMAPLVVVSRKQAAVSSKPRKSRGFLLRG